MLCGGSKSEKENMQQKCLRNEKTSTFVLTKNHLISATETINFNLQHFELKICLIWWVIIY